METPLGTMTHKIGNWIYDFFNVLPNLVVAAIVLVIGFFVAKRLKNLLENKLSRHFPTPTLANLTISIVYIILIGIIVFIALSILGLDKTIKGVLAGAGILGLGLSFAFQDIAANFMSGIFLAFRRPFFKGELIRVKDLEGFVEEVKLRDTTIRTYQGQYITIPNKTVFENAITNYTRLGQRRADIKAGIAKRNDLEKAKKVALGAFRDIPKIIPEKTHFYYREFKGNSAYFVAECWVDSDNFTHYKQFINDCMMALDKAYKTNDIAMVNEEIILDFNDSAEEIMSN